MLAHLTKKLAEKINQRVQPYDGEVDELYSWRANIIDEDGFRFIVFMHDASRFVVVLDNTSNLTLTLPRAGQNMRFHGKQPFC